jgi:hypothetical protein
VSDSEKRRISIPLRLSASLRDHAEALAREDGVSLNHFTNVALAEKLSDSKPRWREETHPPSNAVLK